MIRFWDGFCRFLPARQWLWAAVGFSALRFAVCCGTLLTTIQCQCCARSGAVLGCWCCVVVRCLRPVGASLTNNHSFSHLYSEAWPDCVVHDTMCTCCDPSVPFIYMCVLPFQARFDRHFVRDLTWSRHQLEELAERRWGNILLMLMHIISYIDRMYPVHKNRWDIEVAAG